jgi:radical SAM family uncharacterized protein/radical SAM-linked protein
MPIGWEKIEPFLLQVEKPARYVGGEFNQVVKAEARVRCCLAFPDLYELGMSYHGFRILYERINSREGWAAERAYAPWHDFEALMRAGGVPLYSLETRRTFAEFDWVGFTLQHESNITNVLNMIDLAGLPLESRERTAAHPILVGGGEGAYSPETLAPFLDAFVIGDGEEIVLELMDFFERAKAESWDRPRVLLELARIPGVYVPALYEVSYHEDGRLKDIRPLPELAAAGLVALPEKIEKRLYNISDDLGTVCPVVPLLRTVHDRLVIEIRRGCVNGCRFCQAGMINRPVHERPLEQIVEIARQGLANTGYDEISLLSLSSGDYTLIGPLIARLAEEFGPRGVSVTLPSLRINGFDIALVDQLAGQRRSGFTFAPEAGSERLRRVINKPVDQEHFFELIDDVFQRGWQTVKFYFMIGLPTETDEDLDGIIGTCARAAELGRRHHGKKALVNVTISPFVPKSGTPFEWEAQPSREELERRYMYVRDGIRERAGRGVDVKLSGISHSFLEAVLARGDRRLAAAVRRAWELGARFDGWADSFRPDLWWQAFDEVGIDPAFYANRERAEDEIFPFELIESRVGRRFLWNERRRALREASGQRCDVGPCAGCDVCDTDVHHTLATGEIEQNPEVPKIERPVREHAPRRKKPEHGVAPNASPLPVQRVRIEFTKLGALRYLSHLDFAKVVAMILRRAEAPLAYTQGFNPMPRIQYAPPLSLGMGGEHELVDIMLITPVDPVELAKNLGKIVPDGMKLLSVAEVPLKAPSIEENALASVYRVEITNPALGVTPELLKEKLQAFAEREEFIVEIEKKDKIKPVDLKQSIASIEFTAPLGVTVAIRHTPGLFAKPQQAIGHILGQPTELGRDLRVNRIGFVTAD